MKLEWLERKVVFRISRGFFIFFAAIVTIGLVLSSLLLIYGISPTFKGFSPSEPKPPAPPEVTLNELMTHIGEGKQEEEKPAPEPEEYEMENIVVEDDPLAEKVENLLKDIRAKFDDSSKYPWKSITKRVCVEKYYNKCHSYSRKTTSRGAKEWIERGLGKISNSEKIVLLEAITAMFPLLAKPEEIEVPELDYATLPEKPEEVKKLSKEEMKALSRAEKNKHKKAIKKYDRAIKNYERNLEKAKNKIEKERIAATLQRDKDVWAHQIAMVSSLVDIRLAYGAPPADVYLAIQSLYRGIGEQPVPLPDNLKKDFFNVILQVRKADSKPESLTQYIKDWRRVAEMLPSENVVAGTKSLWKITKEMPPEAMSKNIAALKTTLDKAPTAKRHNAITGYGIIMREKQDAAWREYRNQQVQHKLKLAEQEADYQKSKLKKAKYRNYAFYGVGSGLLGLAIVGLILASLAIERNTRALEKAIDKTK